MKLKFLATSALLLLSSVVVNVQAVKADRGRCDRVSGGWLWDSREFPALIALNGQVVGNDGGTTITATWKCTDSQSGAIQVNWNTGFVDYLTLSRDGQRLEGYSTHPGSETSRPLTVRRGTSR
jgi:hypothetical protein